MSLGDFYNKVQSYAKVGQNVKGQDSYNMHYECWANEFAACLIAVVIKKFCICEKQT